MFRKFLSAACAVSLLFTAACSSLPDGSKKPALTINNVVIATDNKVDGFKITFTMHHNSQKSLPVDEILIDVYVNGRKAAQYIESADVKIEPNKNVVLSRFVKANLQGDIANWSMRQNPMLKVTATAKVAVIFDDSEKNRNFNPQATYVGVISHAE